MNNQEKKHKEKKNHYTKFVIMLAGSFGGSVVISDSSPRIYIRGYSY